MSGGTRRQHGFTIVELLIVIAIIAILAAVVFVSYTNATARARDDFDLTTAVQLRKVAEAVNADMGNYPTGTNDSSLTASFNSNSSTARIPDGVTVKYAASTLDNDDYATVLSDGNNRIYSVTVCSGGLNVYYPQRSSSTVQVAKIGDGC